MLAPINIGGSIILVPCDGSGNNTLSSTSSSNASCVHCTIHVNNNEIIFVHQLLFNLSKLYCMFC